MAKAMAKGFMADKEMPAMPKRGKKKGRKGKKGKKAMSSKGRMKKLEGVKF